MAEPICGGNYYKEIYIKGNARVQLGNEYKSCNDRSLQVGVLSWLSSKLTPGCKHRESFACYVDGTFDWILDDKNFLAFKDRQARNIWCVGGMGTGKTVLTSFVVEHLKKNLPTTRSTCVAVFYCQHGLRDKQPASAILGSLLRQMYEQHSDEGYIPKYVHAAHKIRNSGEQHTSVSPPLLQELKEWFREECLRWQDVFINLDGLDEIDQNQQAELLYFLGSHKLSNIHLFVASRNSLDIKGLLNGPTIVSIRRRDTSLRMVIQSRLDSASGHLFLQRIEAKSSDLSASKKRITDRVLETSDGMFLLAHLSLDRILGSRTLCEVDKCLESLPTSLEAHYDDTWNRIKCQLDSRDVDYATKALAWVVFTQGRLEWTALQEAMYITLSEGALPARSVYTAHSDLLSIADIVGVCHGLLADPNVSLTDSCSSDPGKQRTMFCHFSAMEHFFTHRDSYFPEANNMIVDACSRYLRLSATALRLYLKHPLRAIGIDNPRSHMFDVLQQERLDDYANERFSSLMLDERPIGPVQRVSLCKLPYGFSLLEQLAECWESVLPYDPFLDYSMTFLWDHTRGEGNALDESTRILLLLPELYFLGKSTMLPNDLISTDFRPEQAGATAFRIAEHIRAMASSTGDKGESPQRHVERHRDIISDSSTKSSVTASTNGSSFEDCRSSTETLTTGLCTKPTSIASYDRRVAHIGCQFTDGGLDLQSKVFENELADLLIDQPLECIPGSLGHETSNTITKDMKIGWAEQLKSLKWHKMPIFLQLWRKEKRTT